ncbi:hypothetical protein EBU24_01195 [bacterium]|nr:hypothetical protein [bacterium]
MQNKKLMSLFLGLFFFSGHVIAANNLSDLRKAYSIDLSNDLDLTVGAVGLMCSYATFKALPEVNDQDNQLIKTTKYGAKVILPVAAFGIPKLLIGYVLFELCAAVFSSRRRWR